MPISLFVQRRCDPVVLCGLGLAESHSSSRSSAQAEETRLLERITVDSALSLT